MKENKLKIEIDRPVIDVFDFTINPKNTPRWIDFIIKEEAEEPIGIGARYRNVNKEGERSEYVVSAFEANKIFELSSTKSTYKVRYTYTPLSVTRTNLEYFEWIEPNDGDLENPLTQLILDKLKRILEDRI